MDPILLFLGFIGFIIVSVISSILEKKQQREAERQARESGGEPPVRRAERPLHDWQEQLRRMLNPEAEAPPPVIQRPRPREARERREAPGRQAPPLRPADSPMRPGTSPSDKVSELHGKVAARVRQLEEKKSQMTDAVKGGLDLPRVAEPVRKSKLIIRRPAREHSAVRLLRHPSGIRDAVVASMILAKPKALDETVK